MTCVLVVDDLATERRLLYHALKSDHRVLEAGDGDAVLAQLESEPVDLVLLDLHLPPHPESAAEGVRILQEIRRLRPRCPVVIVTGDQDRGVALDMVRRGVADFLLKPIEAEVLRTVIARALERAALERELEEARGRAAERATFGGLIGRSRAARELFARLEKLARAPTTVLLLGESGTGKSAVARALHIEGPRAAKPFVVVDGATIPESLVESELFGHARGAYTGAEAARTGRIEMADGGTLFLDEIGNLSPAAQAKLLLFLDDHTFTPVGSNQPVRVDVRLVAASNRDLAELVREGRFRADLLFRIQVTTVTLPPLRERREDVGPLAEYFIATLGKEFGRPGARLTPEAVSLLEGYPWPGNVRQLRHALESSLALADRDVLDAGDLALPLVPFPGAEPAVAVPPAAADPSAGAPEAATFGSRVADFERRLLIGALTTTRGNKAAAGRLLGLDENQIRYLCRKHGVG